MSLFKTEMLCDDLWEGEMQIQLPRMKEGDMFYLHFTLRTKARIEGLFVIKKRLDMYDTREGGYLQRIKIEPHPDTRDHTLLAAGLK